MKDQVMSRVKTCMQRALIEFNVVSVTASDKLLGTNLNFRSNLCSILAQT